LSYGTCFTRSRMGCKPECKDANWNAL